MQRFCIFRAMVSNCISTVRVPFARKIDGVPRGEQSLWQGYPKGTVSTLAHDFPQESLVCYTFVERMADGNVAHPCICAAIPAFWWERLPHKRGSLSNRKRLEKDAKSSFFSRSVAEQRYIKSPRPAAASNVKTTTAVPAIDCPAPEPPLTLPGFR